MRIRKFCKNIRKFSLVENFVIDCKEAFFKSLKAQLYYPLVWYTHEEKKSSIEKNSKKRNKEETLSYKFQAYKILFHFFFLLIVLRNVYSYCFFGMRIGRKTIFPLTVRKTTFSFTFFFVFLLMYDATIQCRSCFLLSVNASRTLISISSSNCSNWLLYSTPSP